MLATIAAADSASTVIKKYSVFIYSEAEPHAKYAIYKHTRNFVFYSIAFEGEFVLLILKQFLVMYVIII